MKTCVFYIFLLALPSTITAQTPEVFTIDEFIAQVKTYHPIAKQANLVVDRAEADLLAARGGFDPAFQFNSNNKSLDGVSYYHYNNSELKIPTGVGVNIKAGYENSTGQYINPELTNGVASYAGIELALLNGLLTDKKRTVLRQARIFQQQSAQERMATVNDLLYTAYTSYLEWATAYRLYQVYNNYLDVAENRAKLVSVYYQNGDRSMVDTIEATAQMQSYRLLQSEAQLELNRKIFDLSAHLWTENQEPYLLPNRFIPDTAKLSEFLILPDTSLLATQVLSSHPSLLAGQFKVEILEAEKRLKFQDLLPTVNLQGNLLSKNYFEYKNWSALYFENNYKLGIHVKFPLLFREARGNYRSAKLKITEASLDLELKRWEIQTKMGKYFTEALLFQRQVLTAKQMNDAYLALLRAEELKFSQGESSLFLINTRESKSLEMQEKMIELQLKYLKAYYAIQWAAGLFR